MNRSSKNKEQISTKIRSRGRPRAFEPDVALGKAMDTFRDGGFAATSLDDLSEAMGINRPSLYGTFGDKRELFLKAYERYRAEMAAKFGATDVIDPGQPLTSQVEKIAGKGPDIIFECVGNPGLLNEAFLAAPRGGRIVVAGVCQGMDQIMPLVGIMKELNVQFVLGYTAQEFSFVIDMIAKDRIEALAMVTDRIGLDALPGAFEALRKPSTQCKVMIVH